jgi:hypothetical protein
MDDIPINVLLSNLTCDVCSVFESVPNLSSCGSHAVLLEGHRSWADVHVLKPLER